MLDIIGLKKYANSFAIENPIDIIHDFHQIQPLFVPGKKR